MYKKPFMLNPSEHGELTVAPTTDYRFVATNMYLPIVYLEMADAAREYPLVFIQDQPGLFVLTGLEQNTNAYVSEDGRWQATYIPAIVRNYPFVLAQKPDSPSEFIVAIDAEAPQVLSKDGDRLFFNGEASPFLQQRMKLLEDAKRAEPLTVQWVKALQDSGLLVERSIRIEREGNVSQISGILAVDEDKFNKLPDEEFLTLRRQGLLPLIYAHLLSMANLRQGAIAGKYPELAAKRTVADDTNDDPFALNIDDDTLKFNF